MSFIPEDGFMSIVEGMHLLKLMPLAAYFLFVSHFNKAKVQHT